MSREEDLIRSTTQAIASTVREVPPLQLEQAPDELSSPAGAPHRARTRLRGWRLRRWQAWLVPAAAAAAVVALAASLVLVKGIRNGSTVPVNPATSTAGPGGVPRYYAALKVFGNPSFSSTGNDHDDLVVGDSLTGKTLATFKPPADTVFQNVYAAADDRTFVVFETTSSTGLFSPEGHETVTGSWYEVHLTPGAAHPVRLAKLPVKPMTWRAATPAPGEVYATALSASGTELAVADIPDTPAASRQPQDWQEVKVYSVATGRLLHDWVGHDANIVFYLSQTGWFGDAPSGISDLTWVDRDRALMIATFTQAGPMTGPQIGTVRRLDVAGPATGNLVTDTAILTTRTLSGNLTNGCLYLGNWPPLVSANGTTIACANFTPPFAPPGHVDFSTAPLAGVPDTVAYQVEMPPGESTGEADYVLWVSPSGGTLLVAWKLGTQPARFGVVSHGTFTPLPHAATIVALSGNIVF